MGWRPRYTVASTRCLARLSILYSGIDPVWISLNAGGHWWGGQSCPGAPLWGRLSGGSWVMSEPSWPAEGRLKAGCSQDWLPHKGAAERSPRGAAAGAAGDCHQAFRHVGQGVAHDGESGHVLAEIFGVHLVQGVGLGVVPVEIMGAHGPLAQAGNAVAQQRIDIGATAATGDFTGAEAVEQFADLLQQGHGGGIHAGAKSQRSLGSTIHFDGRHLVLDLAADELAVSHA